MKSKTPSAYHGPLDNSNNVKEEAEKVLEKTNKHPKGGKKHIPYCQVDDSQVPTQDPKKTRFSKQNGKFSEKVGGKKKPKQLTRRERRAVRLKSKKFPDVVIALLPLWEKQRCEATPKEEKFKLSEKMLEIAKDKLSLLCMAHDTSRIIESLIQHGTEAQRWKIYGELRPQLLNLIKSRYASFVILKLLKYGDKKFRQEIFKLFRSRVVRLINHRRAAPIIETIYNEYTSSSQRGQLVHEFFGNAVALGFVENRVFHLHEALALHPTHKHLLLSKLGERLVQLVNKGHGRLSIVQHVLIEYLTELLPYLPRIAPTTKSLQQSASNENEQKADSNISTDEKKIVPAAFGDDDDNFVVSASNSRQETYLNPLIEALLGDEITGPAVSNGSNPVAGAIGTEAQLVPMLHTREGLRVALATLWQANPRQRKLLLTRSLKTCIAPIAKDDQGHYFICALLDYVDDIRLLEKTVIKELLSDLEEMVSHPHARKVLLYALSPRDPRHFAPQLIANLLGPGDASGNSRKPLALRAIELLSQPDGLLPSLLGLAADRMDELFLGDSVKWPQIAEDRLRLNLLAEILVKSLPSGLSPDHARKSYPSRLEIASDETDSTTDITKLKSSTIWPDSSFLKEQEDKLSLLRKMVLKRFVKEYLATEFSPTNSQVNYSGAVKESAVLKELKRKRDQLVRRRRALDIAETMMAKKKKITVKAFSSGIDDEKTVSENTNKFGEEPMEVDVSTNANEADYSSRSRVPIAFVPFLERPEGMLFCRRILTEEKNNDIFDFANMIMDIVPEDILRAWTTCNRSCFVLLHIYELGDSTICSRLKSVLTSTIEKLKTSSFPGSKLLYTRLTG